MPANILLPVVEPNWNTGLPLSPPSEVVFTMYWQRMVIIVSKTLPRHHRRMMSGTNGVFPEGLRVFTEIGGTL